MNVQTEADEARMPSRGIDKSMMAYPVMVDKETQVSVRLHAPQRSRHRKKKAARKTMTLSSMEPVLSSDDDCLFETKELLNESKGIHGNRSLARRRGGGATERRESQRYKTKIRRGQKIHTKPIHYQLIEQDSSDELDTSSSDYLSSTTPIHYKKTVHNSLRSNKAHTHTPVNPFHSRSSSNPLHNDIPMPNTTQSYVPIFIPSVHSRSSQIPIPFHSSTHAYNYPNPLLKKVSNYMFKMR